MIEIHIDGPQSSPGTIGAMRAMVNAAAAIVEESGNPGDAIRGTIAALVYLCLRHHGDIPRDTFRDEVAAAFILSMNQARFQFIPEGGHS